MRIGIDAACLESQRGGVARIVSTMLRVWPTMTTQHHFVLYFERGVPPDDFLRHETFEHRVVPRPAWCSGSSIPRDHWCLPRQARRDRVDLFFSPEYYGPVYPTTAKTVVGLWDISFTTHRDHYPFKEGLRLSWLARHSSRYASGILTCSDYDRCQIEKFYRVEPARICTLQLAPDPKFSHERDPNRIAEVRRKYRLPDRYILSLGVISNRRHVDVIINAFSDVMAEFPDLGLLVVGRDRTVPRIGIAEMMRGLDFVNRGRYLEFVPEEDLIALYHGAWYYICVSTVDGEATMLKEAMRCGTPTITSPLLEAAVDGHALIVADPKSRESLGSAFRRAMDNGVRERFAEEGLAWSRSLSWEQVARVSLEFFESR